MDDAQRKPFFCFTFPGNRSKVVPDTKDRTARRKGTAMIYVICNPTAGSGLGEKTGKRIRKLLEAEKRESKLLYTQYPGHATLLAQQARAEGAELVLAIGGDGTAYETARGLAGSLTPFGIIPAGTGNDFIKAIGIPKNPEKALAHILSHPPRKTDVGEMNGRMFLNEIGTGFDVSVLDYAAKAKKYCKGLLPYLYGVLKTLFRFRSIPITYSIDGGSSETLDAFVLGVANGRMIGGGICIAPEAKADDGLLDVVVVGKVKRRKLPARLVELMRGKILSFPETKFYRASSVTFSAPNMRVNSDGEIISEKTVSARILPGALMICR